MRWEENRKRERERKKERERERKREKECKRKKENRKKKEKSDTCICCFAVDTNLKQTAERNHHVYAMRGAESMLHAKRKKEKKKRKNKAKNNKKSKKRTDETQTIVCT